MSWRRKPEPFDTVTPVDHRYYALTFSEVMAVRALLFFWAADPDESVDEIDHAVESLARKFDVSR